MLNQKKGKKKIKGIYQEKYCFAFVPHIYKGIKFLALKENDFYKSLLLFPEKKIAKYIFFSNSTMPVHV